MKSKLALKARRYLKAVEAGKREYKRADELLSEIAKEAKPGDVITLDKERKAMLMDRFAVEDLVWAHAAARRYELKIISS